MHAKIASFVLLFAVLQQQGESCMPTLFRGCLSAHEEIEDLRCLIRLPATPLNKQCSDNAAQSDFYYDRTAAKCVDAPWSKCAPRGQGAGFKTQRECESSCTGSKQETKLVKELPPQNDLKSSNPDCNLPKEAGISGTNIMCAAYFPSFYYDVKTGKCESFIFGGCGGNANRFLTKGECQEKCVGSSKKVEKKIESSNPLCNLPSESGQCRAFFPSFYYNMETGKCDEFVYGGCEGNTNRFLTEKDCQSTCLSSVPLGTGTSKKVEKKIVAANPLCNLPSESGQCKAFFPFFYYNMETGKCEEFVYGGCEGNTNRFLTEEECQSTCLSSVPLDSQPVVANAANISAVVAI